MKKTIITLALALAMVLGMTTTAFADSTIKDNSESQSLDVTVSYSTACEYEVTIPAKVELKAKNMFSDAIGTATVKATDVWIPSDQKLKVSVSSTQADDSFYLKNGTSSIAYTLTTSYGGTVVDQSVTKGGAVLIVDQTNSSDEGVTATLSFKAESGNINAATATGEHKDTLTFTVGVE